MTWPSTRGLAPVLDPDAVRAYLQETLPVDWGARVDQRINDLQWTGARVAVLAGTTGQTVSRIRAGELLPRDYLRVTLAAALCTTSEALFPFPTIQEIEKAITKRRKQRQAVA